MKLNRFFTALAAASLTLSPAVAATMPAQQAYVKASNTGAGDYFSGVALSGDTMVVGASGESSSATGVNGNQSDNSAPQSGAVYVFVRNGTNWVQQAYLKASNTGQGDYFGLSVAISCPLGCGCAALCCRRVLDRILSLPQSDLGGRFPT